MTFLTGKHIPRRTFLRSVGVTIGLPFLDAMVPAGKPWWATTAGRDKPRLICLEMVHGAAGCHEWGASQHLWAPARIGHDFDLSPTSLRSLEPYQDYLTIVSNTDVKMAESFAPEEIGADHFRTTSVFLTQSHPRQTEGSNVYVGTSPGPDLREKLRTGHSASIHAAYDRARGSIGRVRIQLLLRVHGLFKLGIAHRSPSHDP